MLILLACIFLNSLIVVVFKLFDKYNVDNLQAIVTNYFVCVITAGFFIGSFPIPSDIYNLPWFWYAVSLGVIFALSFNILALTVQNFGIVIATIFQKMSLVAPALFAIFVFGESSGIMKWIGIGASLFAIGLLGYNNDKQIKSNKTQNALVYLFPIFTFLCSCLIDSGLYYIDVSGLVTGGKIEFVASLFFFAGVSGLLFLIYRIIKGDSKLNLKSVFAGVLLGIPNFFSIYLLLLALNQGWGGSVVFPLNNVGVLVLASLYGFLLFKEKLSAVKIIGIILSLFAIYCISQS